MRSALLLAFLSAAAQCASSPQDWPNFARYHEANAKLAPPAPGETRVVFMGDSITDAWAKDPDVFFPGKPYIGRGISGQTTPQMLVRFRADVVALKPKVVVILAGTNDIAGNTGPTTPEAIEDNFMSMAELAKANGIRVVIASILPAADYPWRPGLHPDQKIPVLNEWLKGYCAGAGFVYLDYFSAVTDGHNGMRKELSQDGVHPNKDGYAIMEPLAEKAIAAALAQP
ncbi:MAG TPA: SGNH/GDSL hydrolase family protein [Bryobacteraceae bacterium]|jgi:lysophospholipase L1-like esterase|nr:SGNH/GDSL hydrolase family protein [Bryobacteraceae bacterium]